MKCRQGCPNLVVMDSDRGLYYKCLKLNNVVAVNLNDDCVFEEKDMKGTIEKTDEILDAMKELLAYKNKKYGDSALNPNNIFYKGNATNSILIRLDDKLSRIKNRSSNEPPTIDDAVDIVGYLVLLLASMNAKREDIFKYKD